VTLDKQVLLGSGYGYQPPEGWLVPDPVPGFEPDTWVADLDDADGFADNINVLVMPGTASVQQAEAEATAGLGAVGATDIEVLNRKTIDGVEAAHFAAAYEAGAYRTEQFQASTYGQTYVVTFSFSDHVPSAQRAAVTDAVLSSWEWMGS